MISVIPIRTGMVLEKGIAYFCAGIFPNEGVTMFALNIKDGKKIWSKPYNALSPQGYMLTSSAKLYVPTGRSTPEVYSIKNGKKLGSFRGNGGTFAILNEETFIYGGGDLGELEIRNPNSDDQIASFNGVQIIVTKDVSYLRSDNEISAINRIKYSKDYKKWKNVEDKKLNLKNWINNSSKDNWRIVNKNGTWAKIKRCNVPGSGEWTHLYAESGNTSCSKDKIQAPMQIQWFGRPGPRRIINRHSRPMSSLFKNGRIFIPADNRIISVDAYNGTLLWELDVPNSRILGALKDCGNMVTTDKYVYIAVKDECRAVNVENGKVVFKLKMPQLIKRKKRDWGYLAAVKDQVIGTGKKQGASFSILGRFNCDILEGDFREMISSDYIFSLNRYTGKKLWSYQNGVIFNSTVAVGDEFVYFVESRNKKAVNDVEGRMRVDHFCKGKTYIVKLDMRTGKKIWEKEFHFPFQQIMFLSYAEKTVLIKGSYNKGKYVHYGLFAFNAETGEKNWKNSFRGGNTRWQTDSGKSTIDGSHGEQWQHPVIIGKTIYLPPYDFNLQTGKKGNYYLTRGGHGCGGLSGSANYMFARGSNPRVYQLTNEAENGAPLTKVNRPGCWINIIPAGGLVMIPESSSGCTCNYPIQSSFVFVPKND